VISAPIKEGIKVCMRLQGEHLIKGGMVSLCVVNVAMAIYAVTMAVEIMVIPNITKAISVSSLL
jgi:hypothetical protein